MLRRTPSLIVGLLLAACSQGAAPSDTPTPVRSVAATPEPTPEPTEEPSPTARPTPTPTAAREFIWAHPFTATVPDGWVRLDSGPTTLVFEVLGSRYLQFTTARPDEADTWLERIQTAPHLVAGEPAPTEIDGKAGVVIDFVLGESANQCPQQGNQKCFQLIRGADSAWIVAEGGKTRAWIIDMDGSELLIITDAEERPFDSWVEQVEAVLATLTWSD